MTVRSTLKKQDLDAIHGRLMALSSTNEADQHYLGDLINLARLGLWAQDHGIPLLDLIKPSGDWYLGFEYEAKRAREALPSGC